MNNQTDWAQKYRPQHLEEMILPASIKSRLMSIRDKGYGPSLLLHGLSGTGKTTAAGLINRNNMIKINCSIHNKINDVRELQRTCVSPSLYPEDGVRVVLMDESDYLTNEAQAGLRGTMEDLSVVNMFVFTANIPGNLIDALRSRLVGIDFGVVKGDPTLRREMIKRTCLVLENEKLSVNNSIVSELAPVFRIPSIALMLPISAGSAKWHNTLPD
jgi:replication factor C small subunit